MSLLAKDTKKDYPSRNLMASFEDLLQKPFPSEGIGFKGHVRVERRDEYGNLMETRDVNNLITNIGFDAVCNNIGSLASRPSLSMNYTSIGTGATAASANQTTLITELDVASNSYDHTAGTKTYDAYASYGPGVSGAVVESCLRDAYLSGTGNMLNRQVFTAVNMTSSDTLQVKWTISVS